MGFIIALLSGALMSIQGVFNTEVTKQTSVWVAAGWVQLTAFITCVVIWMFTGREPVAGIMQVTPKYVLVGGTSPHLKCRDKASKGCLAFCCSLVDTGIFQHARKDLTN